MKRLYVHLIASVGRLFQAISLIMRTLASHSSLSVPHDSGHRATFRLVAEIIGGNGLGIMCPGLLAPRLSPRPGIIQCGLASIPVGTLLFAASVSLIAPNVISRAPTAPIGGSLQITGWTLAAMAFFPIRRRKQRP